jgi:DNA modification methylase
VPGLKPKDLVGIPWEVALALRRDGWWLRSDIIWSKPNPMPESVTDRPTKAHEYLFLLTKAEHYFYDADAIREPVAGTAHSRGNGVHPKSAPAGSGIKANESFSAAIKDLVDERNKRSVWEIATQPYPGSHFATFPSALTEPCILAGSAKGDWVLDPFAGSGTTALVALEHQRRAILVDINHPYLQDLAAGRLMRVARVPVVDHKPEGALL